MQPPPPVSLLNLDFPAPHVLLLTLNRPDALNAVSPEMADDLERVLAWFDAEPSLWVVIVTGAGRVFCAGADLKTWHRTTLSSDAASASDNSSNSSITSNSTNTTTTTTPTPLKHTPQSGIPPSPHGFAHISRRTTSAKPMVAAVQGAAYGGGVELVLNCDVVVAAEDATFGLVEVRRGVVAAQGGIPRLAAVAGHQLASEMLLTGRVISAQEAYSRFRFVNVLAAPSAVLPTAVALARSITAASPDAVYATKRALVLAAECGGVEEARERAEESGEVAEVYGGENIREGLAAFTEKRKPVWKNPAKL